MLSPRPLLRVWGCVGYPALLSAGWGFVPRSVAQLAPCSRLHPLTRWSSLRLRVLGGSWFSPLCSPGHRSASRSTCSALPPVSGLFFWAWRLLLRVRLRPLPDDSLGTLWLPQRLLCPPCGCESARVLPSLLGPSSSGVCHLSRVVPQLEALSESLTHSIPRSFLVVALSTSVVGFADALWLCPERALSRFFASVSLIDPIALSTLLHSVFADGFRHWCAFRFCGGASPHAFGSVGALGELQWLHLYRLTPDLVGLRQFAV